MAALEVITRESEVGRDGKYRIAERVYYWMGKRNQLGMEILQVGCYDS